MKALFPLIDGLQPVQASAPATEWTLAKIEATEKRLLKQPQVEIPLTHRFGPGVYVREVLMPAGSCVIGHCHRTEHFNVVLSGRAMVMMNGQIQEVKAPDIFLSGAGVRKVLVILEDMRWATIHPTEETDLKRLEELLIIKSESFLAHERELAALQQHITENQIL